MNRFSVTVLTLVVTFTVAGCGGIVKANHDGYTTDPAAPRVASISPHSGDVSGGTSVSITGKHFLAGALVFFGSTQAQTVTVSSAKHIQAVTPPVDAAGPVDVTVQNPDNRSGKLTAGFTYNSSSSGGSPPPTILAISPDSGATGTPVTITGTNFESGATVRFGSTSASSVSFISAMELLATVPAINDGTYDVTVTNPDPASTTLHNGFTVNSGSSDPSDPPPSHDSLLSGCTVSEANNKTTCTAPGGWTIIAQEGFGGGTVHMAGNSTYEGNSISTAFATEGHNFTLNGLYNSDGNMIGGRITTTGVISGTINDLYMSYWDWEDSNALIPQELGIAGFQNCDGCANQQEFGWDWQGQALGDGKSHPSDPMVAVTNCLGTDCNATFFYPGGATCQPQFWCDPPYQGSQDSGAASSLAINAGHWRQYEIWWHPNTVTNGVANADGFLRLYVNGALTQLISHYAPAGLRGTGTGAQLPTMQNPNPTGFIEYGGVITAFCGVNEEQGRANPFSICPTYTPTPFHRAIDDVIIMKK